MEEAKQGADEPVDPSPSEVAHEQAGVSVPTESAMSRKLQQIINKFKAHREGSTHFRGEEEEATHLDHVIKQFLDQKNHAYARKHRWPDRGHYEPRSRSGKQIWTSTS